MTAGAVRALVRVVVVDVTPARRRALRIALEAERDVEVVGEARNAPDALALVERVRPDVVLLALDLPGEDVALHLVERVMAACPTPIVVHPGDLAAGPAETALAEALSSGAVETWRPAALPPGPAGTPGPPGPPGSPGPAAGATDSPDAVALRGAARLAARVRVITHPRGRLHRSAVPVQQPRTREGDVVPLTPPGAPDPEVRLVVVGASTGGPQALLTLLAGLPPDLPQAVLVVQHMAEGFVPGLAAWLDDLVPLPVTVAVDGQVLRPGTVTVAPSGSNLLVVDNRPRVRLAPPEHGQFHVPSVDVALRSAAEVLGPRAAGVVLTGMGRDGAAGLLALRSAGGVALGQDEGTSAVYGMPAAAMAAGAVEEQVPLPGMAQALLGRLRERGVRA